MSKTIKYGQEDERSIRRGMRLLKQSAPSPIEWNNTGIPSDSSNLDENLGDALIGGEVAGAQFGSRDLDNANPVPGVSDLTSGPNGNMFGPSTDGAVQGVIQNAYDFQTRAASVRDEFLPVEEAEGFGEPDAGGTIIGPYTNRRIG